MILGIILFAAAPASAQQQQQGNGSDPVFTLPGGAARPGGSPRQQGPELDVFRDPAPTVNVPPVVIPPPAQQPAPRPGQPPATRPAEPQPRAAPPARPASEPRAQASRTAPERAPQEAAPAQGDPAPVAPSAPTTPSAPTATPQPAPQAAPEPTPAQPAPARPGDAPLWPWIAGGLALLAIMLALALRRRRTGERAIEPEAPAPVPETPPVPAPVAPAPASITPAAPTPEPAPDGSADGRPWLEIALAVRTARLSLIGATVGYRLTIHNRGAAAAQDVLVRALIANADAGQQAMIQRFFAGETGLPLHSVVSIAPGESQWLDGEVRLDAAQIAPVQAGQRALLVPLVAIDAQYRWADESGDLIGAGRTARAFIIGQEQQPPTDRLSPFRLDLGPRQYRSAASRATALALAS